MKEEYKVYYLYLEKLRRSGITNMYGAGSFLANEFDMSIKEANMILTNWMTNYSEINAKYYSD